MFTPNFICLKSCLLPPAMWGCLDPKKEVKVLSPEYSKYAVSVYHVLENTHIYSLSKCKYNSFHYHLRHHNIITETYLLACGTRKKAEWRGQQPWIQLLRQQLWLPLCIVGAILERFKDKMLIRALESEVICTYCTACFCLPNIMYSCNQTYLAP